MRRNRSSGTCGKNSRSSAGPECTKRKPTWENCALPPDSCLGAFSSMTTLSAPAFFAAIAASSAAEPPPITITSQVVLAFMGGVAFNRTFDRGSAVDEVLIFQFRARIGQRALGHLQR